MTLSKDGKLKHLLSYYQNFFTILFTADQTVECWLQVVNAVIENIRQNLDNENLLFKTYQ